MADVQDEEPASSGKSETQAEARQEKNEETKVAGDRSVTSDPHGVPGFAKNFPDDPELRTLIHAFEQGRYDVVRDRAPKLAEATRDPNVAAAAKELRRRLDADPLAVKLLFGVLVLLTFLTAWAYLHQPH